MKPLLLTIFPPFAHSIHKLLLATVPDGYTTLMLSEGGGAFV